MTDTPSATARPWRLEMGEDELEITAPSRRGKIPIAALQVGFKGPIEREQAANAALIVTAVNERETLKARIAALEAALHGLLAHLGPNGYIAGAGKTATDRARSALQPNDGE